METVLKPCDRRRFGHHLTRSIPKTIRNASFLYRIYKACPESRNLRNNNTKQPESEG